MAASAQIVEPPNAAAFIPGSMPLSNSQWELFAKAYAAGESATQSAIHAGFSELGAHNTGSRLLKNKPEVRTRVEFLKGATLRANPDDVPKRWVVHQALMAQDEARLQKNVQANLACLQFIARLEGFIDTPGGNKSRLSTMIDARTVNFFQVPTTQLRNALEAHLAEVPMAERAALLEAAPEIAEALNQAPAPSVQDTFAGDSEQV